MPGCCHHENLQKSTKDRFTCPFNGSTIPSRKTAARVPCSEPDLPRCQVVKKQKETPTVSRQNSLVDQILYDAPSEELTPEQVEELHLRVSA